MFENFLNDAGSLGLKYIDNKYVSPEDANSSQKEKQAQKYEQIQQKSSAAPLKSPLDNKLFIYGGIGAVVLLTAVVALKSK